VKNTLRITKSTLVISKNDRIDCGYYVDHRVYGILPGCRKEQLLSPTTMQGYIWVKPLYSYNGVAFIHPSEWLKLIKSSPVKTSRLTEPHFSLTSELIELAYREASKIADNECANDFTYKPVYDTLVSCT
jgi:hypothetical protein